MARDRCRDQDSRSPGAADRPDPLSADALPSGSNRDHRHRENHIAAGVVGWFHGDCAGAACCGAWRAAAAGGAGLQGRRRCPAGGRPGPPGAARRRGVLGKKLVLDVEDDACDPKQARSVAEKIASAKIPFVAGHYCSSSSIPASEAYADGNVLQITPASTNPLYTERKLWNVARVCGRDDQQGLVAAEFIAKNYKGKNVAILNDKTTYGKGLADETKKALNKAGVTEKMFESYNKGDKDFNAIVDRKSTRLNS